jgi:DNA-binding PadR family transcriptional regulator
MSMDSQDGVSAKQLYQELGSDDTATEAPEGESSSERIVADVRAELPVDREFRFDEDLLKKSLDDLLLVLIALQDGGAHGKGLMGELASSFDVHLSPGTVYPRLHSLEEEGLLEVHELVQTKKYSIADEERVRRRVERTLQHHLAIGSVFHAALAEI